MDWLASLPGWVLLGVIAAVLLVIGFLAFIFAT